MENKTFLLLSPTLESIKSYGAFVELVGFNTNMSEIATMGHKCLDTDGILFDELFICRIKSWGSKIGLDAVFDNVVTDKLEEFKYMCLRLYTEIVNNCAIESLAQFYGSNYDIFIEREGILVVFYFE